MNKNRINTDFLRPSSFKILISRVVKDQFFSATVWMFLGIGFMNVGNYLYHLLMGRMLGVVLYGALESIISALYIISVPTLTMNLVIVRYAAHHKGRGEHKQIENLYSYVARKLFIFGIPVLLLLLIFSPAIKSFLHLPSIIIALLLPISFFLNLFYFLNKSVLQGVSSFFKLSMLNLVESVAKLTFSVLLVYIGYRVEGAYGAVIISMIVAMVVSFSYLKKIVKFNIAGKDYINARELLKFSLPTFITSLALISMFTTDVVLVRHFFPGPESGYYSALSVMGKIVYFAVSPIVLVLFPMVSEHHAKGESYSRILAIGTFLTLFISLLITIIFFAAPEIMIIALFGEKYLSIAGMLGIFGVFVSVLSLCGLFANFYLSIHKTSSAYVVGLAAILQIFLITFFHNSISDIISVSLLVAFLLLIFLLLYYPHAIRKK